MTKFRIYGRRQREVNTDPQRRCYNGCHARSEWVWSDWYSLGEAGSEKEAEESVASWTQINPIRHEYKFNPETTEFPSLDPYYTSREFLALAS